MSRLPKRGNNVTSRQKRLIIMKVQRLNEEMFAPMEQNEMMAVLGGGKTKIHKLTIAETNVGGNPDTTIESVTYKQKD